MAKISGKQIKLILFLTLDTLIFFSEVIIGYMTNSLALIADAFHVFNDMASLVVAIWAVHKCKNEPESPQYTFGWKRAEILGAFINSVSLLTLCLTLSIQAFQRLIEASDVSEPVLVLIVGCLGLFSNLIGMVLFHEHGHGHSHSHGSSSHAHTHGFVIDDEEDDDNRIQDLEMMPHCHSHSEDHHHHDDHDHHDHYRHYHHETSKETAVASSSSTSSLNTDDSDSITVIQSPLLNQAHKSNDESSTSSSPSSSISTSFSPSSVSSFMSWVTPWPTSE
ncbi:unnamed protein product [Ambrosiozyma monospora]|uniref:Unnamed protein product n=1 Tax=Ambrosiozyma monospora TaxID=43982 RepID=A0ACB5T6N6_AMBMO|nr:unnamed protein product [Ambrosiozyma monospora]